MSEPFDIADVTFVKRLVVGNTNPERMLTDEQIQQQMEMLNRCLKDTPRGRIIGQEKGFCILRIGEHQVVLQHVVYHLGFKRKPSWFEN